MKSTRFLKRKVPAWVMRLTRKCPGYSIGSSRVSYARGEGRQNEAGVRPQVLVGSLLVVQPSEIIDRALLGDDRGARGPNGIRLSRFVHAFMGAVLLRLAGQDPLMLNAEAHPPHIE